MTDTNTQKAQGSGAVEIGSGKGVIPDAMLDSIIDNPHPADDDAAFVTVWMQLEARGYLWSESNVEKVHFGWLLARALSQPPEASEGEAVREACARIADMTPDDAIRHSEIAERIRAMPIPKPADQLGEARPEVAALREALEQIELLSTNHGGWFEADPWDWGQAMGQAARAALKAGGE